MKQLILIITTIVLSSCQVEYVKSYTCGKVIDKIIHPTELNCYFKIVYQTKEGYRLVHSDYGDESTYIKYDIGDDFCECHMTVKHN